MKFALDMLNTLVCVCVCPKIYTTRTNPHSYVATEGDFQSFNRIMAKTSKDDPAISSNPLKYQQTFLELVLFSGTFSSNITI